MKDNEQFWSQVRARVRECHRVAELYHGEKDDILRGLAQAVTKKGAVFGIDYLNPFSRHEHMRQLQTVPQITLLSSAIPPNSKRSKKTRCNRHQRIYLDIPTPV